MAYTLSVLTIVLLVVQASPTVQTLVNGIERTLAAMKDFSADFEQISTDSSNQVYRARGHLDLKRDGNNKKMHAEYKSPEARVFISDGKMVTDFTPAINQAVQGPVKKSENELIPFMLLLGDKAILDGFGNKQLLVGTTLVPGQSTLRLFPNDKKLPVVELEVDPKTYLVHRLVFKSPTGERNEYIFKDPKANQGLPASLFEFKPSPGVEVKTLK